MNLQIHKTRIYAKTDLIAGRCSECYDHSVDVEWRSMFRLPLCGECNYNHVNGNLDVQESRYNMNDNFVL